jgi:hypothetical protein
MREEVLGNLLHRVETGSENNEMNSSPFTPLRVDQGDLCSQHELLLPCCREDTALTNLYESFFQFLDPFWMGEVASTENVDALNLGPFLQVLDGEILAATLGEARMKMKICDELLHALSEASSI